MCDLVSVVIPVYNVEDYLDECLESVVSQTYKKLEIVVVNDGSTDNSALKAWGQREILVLKRQLANGLRF